jgi:hypothetical protein
MPLTREDLRASIERAGDEHWQALIRYHEEVYPASRPVPGDICRWEAERLNAAGYGDAGHYELLTSLVEAGPASVTLVHLFRDRQSGQEIRTPAFTNYE